MSTFPHAPRSRPGYTVDEVEAFLQRARQAYDGVGDVSLTSDEIRHTAFSMRKRGYETGAVDAALERLEDAFAGREREIARRSMGEQAWVEQARASAREIVSHLQRPRKHRFARTTFLSHGYSTKEVDAFTDRLRRYFHDGTPVGIDEVRSAVFAPQRAGYKEAQVDLLLDSVTKVMLAVR